MSEPRIPSETPAALEQSANLTQRNGRLAWPPEVYEAELPLQRVYYWEKEHGSRPLFSQSLNGSVLNWTWAKALQEVRSIAAYLRARNWPPQSNIVLISKNCAWSVMADLAIWMAGHVTVPIYPSLPAFATRHIFGHCEPVACFLGCVEDASITPATIAPGIPTICLPNAVSTEGGVLWDALVADTRPLSDSPVRQHGDLATIIYTSGTTGEPKGAMHTFLTFAYFAKAIYMALRDHGEHRILSYLPLAHIAERALAETASLYEGWLMFFGESTKTFFDDLRRARPTIFFSVPRLYWKFREGVRAKLPQNRMDRLVRFPIVSGIVKRRVLYSLGLDQVRFAASGAAALPLELLEWYRALGLPLIEGYGTTEIGITHVPPGSAYRPGYVGKNAPGVETKISDQGEVLVKSPMNMVGYYKNPVATREVFTADGFIHTGDLGELDDGWLKITGRSKDQFKTSKGKFVQPANLEMMLAAHSALESCLVMGCGLPCPIAIVVLTSKAAESAATPEGKAALESSLKELLKETNQKVPNYEQLKFIAVTDAPWTVAREFVTPTQKLRRHVIEKFYSPFFEEWSSQNSLIVWHSEK